MFIQTVRRVRSMMFSPGHSGRALTLALAGLGACVPSGAYAAERECEPGWVLDEDPAVTSARSYRPLSAPIATTWDSDGEGPEPEWLVVGFGRNTIDIHGAAPIQAWDGNRWFPLGRPGGLSYIDAMGVYKGSLIVQGDGMLLRWDGGEWLPFAPGLNGTVKEFLEFDGDLWAIGAGFPGEGATGTCPTMRWNGEAWQIPDTSFGGIGVDLCVYDGSLYMSGSHFIVNGRYVYGVFRWDDSAWTQVGSADSSAGPMVVHENKLVVLGTFSNIGGVPAVQAAQWDGGQWTGLPDNIPSLLNGGTLVSHNGKLYSTYRDGREKSGLHEWNGETSIQVYPPRYNIGPFGIRSLVVYNDMLVLVGVGERNLETPHASVIGWDGLSWVLFHGGYSHLFVATKSAAPIPAALHKDEVYIAGPMMNSQAVVSWNGQRWRLLGTDMRRVDALISFVGELFAGGDALSVYDSTNAQDVAVWRDGVWKTIGFGQSGRVHAFAEFGGKLVVGGSFSNAGEGDSIVACQSVAIYDGTQWTPMGDSLQGTVYAFVVYNGELYAGGNFVVGGSEPAVRGVARWDGTNWVGVNIDVVGSVVRMTSFEGNLVIGGDFTIADNSAIKHLARWNGSMWSSVGDTAWLNGPVRSMDVHQGQLIIGGGFYGMLSDHTTAAVARFDGGQWKSLAGSNQQGISPYNSPCVISDGELLHVVGVRSMRSKSYGTARWDCEVPPCVADMDGSGGVDVLDLFAYINAWITKDAAADVNADEAVDVADLFAFINAWLARC